MKAAIVPAGAWGAALAVPLSEHASEVALWLRAPAEALLFARRRQTGGEAVPSLPGARFPDHVWASSDLAQVLRGAELVVVAAPGRAVREVAALLAGSIDPSAVVLSVSKGIEPESLKRLSQVVAEVLGWPDERLAVLSGPNFALEVARRQPTATVVASVSRSVAEFVQGAFMTASFRVYTNPDVTGVELGGALKNVIVLGAGMAEGLGLGLNTRAALITRGLAEMARLGIALGANPLTFAGLSGLGDLVLTATGDLSRNRRAGQRIGAGEPPETVLNEPGTVIEGAPTARAAVALAARMGVEMPITEHVEQVLFHGLRPADALRHLMGRQPANEIEEVARQFWPAVEARTLEEAVRWETDASR